MAEEKRLKNLVIKELMEKYKTIWALNHLGALANWDLNTYMPEEGARSRAEALAKLSVLSQSIFLDKDFVSLIKKAENEKGLNDYEKAVIRLLNRTLKYYQKLPPDFIEEFTKVTSEAHIVWKNAKEQDNFSLFAPFLEKIVELTRKKAELLGYKKHPYDALLDEYEEGLTTEDCENFFAQIKEPLKNLISYIKKSSNYREKHELEEYEYNREKMKAFADFILNSVHYNMNHLRIDLSPHPFSMYLGKGDNRITMRFKDDFAKVYSSAMHEYGHALYGIQSHEDFNYTNIEGGTSLVIHESQSRFWENFIGKSKSFLASAYGEMKKVNPKLEKYSPDEIYYYINLVRPSLIRTEADEVTYHMHIMIRFEIEKALIEGKIQVKDLPRIWDEKYKEYLGIGPKTNKEGVLQDVHWSGGSIGYFPTYSMGTALSALWKKHIEKDLGKIDELVKTKEGIGKIQNWLMEKIHQHGSTYLYNELLQKSTGENFSAQPLLDYLEEKYKTIY
ncbi:MAG: carboxypeptidase M32 [Nanoarchaeota archaeon]